MQNALALVPRKGLQLSGRAGRHSQADWSTLQGSGTLKSLRDFLLQEPRCKAQLAFGKDASSPSRSHSSALQKLLQFGLVLLSFEDGCSSGCLGHSGTSATLS